MTELDPQLNQEARSATTSNVEVPFHVSEIFFSRTDERGVIASGNDVFQRVSGFEWSEILGAPHKILRHPDMPRGLFQLAWDTIKSGKPIGFFVKNRDKKGRYYWVFALISPDGKGFISIRIKPTTELVKQVEPLYADLRRRENEKKLNPSESADAIKQAVHEMGHANYMAFQTAALAAEFQSRSQHMGRAPDQMQKRITAMSDAILQVQNETNEMTEAFKAIRTVPMNMRIIASRLESAGGPISAISVNYSQMLEEMATWVKTFVEGDDCVFARIRDAIVFAQFLLFASALAGEFREQPKDHDDPEIAQRSEADHKALLDLTKSYMADAIKALNSVESEATRFGRSVLDMKRFVTGLSSTRMMCKIESASLSNSGTALAGIVDQLDACQNEIEARLARMVELNSVIQSNTAMLRSLF